RRLPTRGTREDRAGERSSRRTDTAGRAAQSGRIEGRAVRRPVLTIGAIAIALGSVAIAAPEGQRAWFKFSKGVINGNQAHGEAFGALTASTWGAAASAHSSKCGGNDAELRIGALEGNLGVPQAQSPVSGNATSDDTSWGVVFELP